MPHTKETSAPTRTADNRAILLQEHAPFAVTESFRHLMTNLSFVIPKASDGSGRSICISSPLTGEGKSSICVNLALACANSGKKTLLLDCDMRKPRVRKLLGVRAEGGMSELLSGQADWNEVLVRNVVAHLDVVCCRKVAPNPLALVQGERFQKLLAAAVREYEYVLIDTPPINVVSDAMAIAAQTDGIALVVRQMLSTHKMLQQAITSLELADVNFLGFVLNCFNLKDTKKYRYRDQY